MRIDEAIRHLTFLVEKRYSYFDNPEFESIKLGIEALKFHKNLTDGYGFNCFRPLSGETRE